MNRFVIQCKDCGVSHEVKNGLFGTNLFATKRIKCNCGKLIDVNDAKMIVLKCKECGSYVMYDRSKGIKPECPICKSNIVDENTFRTVVEIHCPSCKTSVFVTKNEKGIETCPMCDKKIDILYEIRKNEALKKNVPNLIECETIGDCLIWKHPITDFNYGSQLIVRDGEEAVLVKNGLIFDCFNAGRYTLTLEEMPEFTKVYKDNEATIKSELYFVNKLVQHGIKWGTDTKIKIIENISGMAIEIGCFGDCDIRVINSKQFLSHFIGSTPKYDDEKKEQYSAKAILMRLKTYITSTVKSVLAAEIKEKNINIFEIDLYLIEISKTIKDKINCSINEFGLKLEEFSILSITLPEDDPNFKKFKDQFAEKYLKITDEKIKNDVVKTSSEREIETANVQAQKSIIAAKAEAEILKMKSEAEAISMKMKGYTYKEDQEYQIRKLQVQKDNNLKNSAWNCKCGNKDILSKFCPNCGEPGPNMPWNCPNCGKNNIKTKFCPDCGTKR